MGNLLIILRLTNLRFSEVRRCDMKREKPCKRKKCPYYNVEYRLCKICEWNPEGVWILRKKGEQR